jgi:prepilin-type N-terminal cleavage/methylation domain-containing protein
MNMIEKRKAMAGQGGFTLIELLVVIAILAVLGGAAVIGIGQLRDNASEEVCNNSRETIETAAEAFNVSEGSYPADVTALVNSGYLKEAPANGTFSINSTTGVVTATC